MKPKEFDELIKQRFDQGDFAYEARNWDQLAGQLDGRAKKRSIMMWWWAPLVGMAASVALAMGVTALIRHDEGAAGGSMINTELAQESNKFTQLQPVADNADRD